MFAREYVWLFGLSAAGFFVWASATFIPSSGQEATISSVVPQEPTPDGTWERFESPRYGIVLEYPSDWQVVVDHQAFAPVISVMPATAQAIPVGNPLEKRTHVSLYPRGLPEAVYPYGIPRRAVLSKAPDLPEVEQFLLVEGSVWGLRARLGAVHTEAPGSVWGPQAFLFAAVPVDGSVTWCERDGERIPDERCDPLFGDLLMRDGGTQEQDWLPIEHILTTLRIKAPDVTSDAATQITQPRENARITSPAIIRGTAPSSLTFEGYVWIELLDEHGTLLGETFAAYDSTTSEFAGTLRFSETRADAGYLLMRTPGIEADATAANYTIPVRLSR